MQAVASAPVLSEAQIKDYSAKVSYGEAIFIVTAEGVLLLKKNSSTGQIIDVGIIDTKEYINEVKRIASKETETGYESFSMLPRNVISMSRQKGYGSCIYAIQMDPTVIPYRIRDGEKTRTFNLALPYTTWIVRTSKNAVTETVSGSSVFFSDRSFWKHGNMKQHILYNTSMTNVNWTDGGICMGSANLGMAAGTSIQDRIASIPNVFFTGVANYDIMPYYGYGIIAKTPLRLGEGSQYVKYLAMWEEKSKEDPLFWFKTPGDKWDLPDSSSRTLEKVMKV